MEPASLETVRLTEFDLHLFAEGTHARLYEKFGAHPVAAGATKGTHFSVWAPNARRVSVAGDFNAWKRGATPLEPRGDSGVWEAFVPGVGPGALYKYAIDSRLGSYRTERADPFGFAAELRPQTASRVCDLDGYRWDDAEWMARRGEAQGRDAPIAIYELHLGSWRRGAGAGNPWLTYAEIAEHLIPYVKEMGYTHVELLPVTEHPFDGSWGYQTVGYFAPTSRFGSPQDFMRLVDALHREGIGVILDWVPAHFPRDEHGLGYFDGTHLYEHADPRQGEHPDWGTFIFNYGRNEVRNFLHSNARFWLERYHVDGLRIDAVASMLYLDYSRAAGQWIPNRFGGRENLEAIDFLRQLNEQVAADHPDTLVFAEESTAWPGVSRPVHLGGLGFHFKWDMGWMHDALDYFRLDPIHRRFHHQRLTFRTMYAFSENFVLPLSHDEVVHGKGSLFGRMPGDEWQRFANLRLLHAFMYVQPGKKLLFMGGEFGQYREWNHDGSLDWDLLEQPSHAGVRRLVADLNRLYREQRALHQGEQDPACFEWVDCNDADQSALSLLRRGRNPADLLLAVLNFTPVPRHAYRVGVPRSGVWREVLNTDATLYGGSGQGNLGGVEARPVRWHGRDQSLALILPPLAMVVLAAPTGVPVAEPPRVRAA